MCDLSHHVLFISQSSSSSRVILRCHSLSLCHQVIPQTICSLPINPVALQAVSLVQAILLICHGVNMIQRHNSIESSTFKERKSCMTASLIEPFYRTNEKKRGNGPRFLSDLRLSSCYCCRVESFGEDPDFQWLLLQDTMLTT